MRCNYIREKKYQCGDDYMAVGVFSIIPQEHRGRGKKRKESSEGQKAKNKMDSLRKRQRKALTNFSPAGMFLTGTYEDPFLPEDILTCRRDVENYKRRVMAATCKRFGARREDIRLMLVAVRKGEAGRLHMHGFAECPALQKGHLCPHAQACPDGDLSRGFLPGLCKGITAACFLAHPAANGRFRHAVLLRHSADGVGAQHGHHHLGPERLRVFLSPLLPGHRVLAVRPLLRQLSHLPLQIAYHVSPAQNTPDICPPGSSPASAAHTATVLRASSSLV